MKICLTKLWLLKDKGKIIYIHEVLTKIRQISIFLYTATSRRSISLKNSITCCADKNREDCEGNINLIPFLLFAYLINCASLVYYICFPFSANNCFRATRPHPIHKLSVRWGRSGTSTFALARLFVVFLLRQLQFGQIQSCLINPFIQPLVN